MVQHVFIIIIDIIIIIIIITIDLYKVVWTMHFAHSIGLLWSLYFSPNLSAVINILLHFLTN